MTGGGLPLSELASFTSLQEERWRSRAHSGRPQNSQAGDLCVQWDRLAQGQSRVGVRREERKGRRREISGEPGWASRWRGLRGAPGPSEEREEMCLFIPY